MGISSMKGTPWQVETIKKDENDDRRHKSRCKYNKNNHCIHYNRICIGSAHCDIYSEINIDRKNEPKYNRKPTVVWAPISNGLLYGTFEVLFIDDNEIMSFEIDKNINREADLVKLVANNEKNSIFEIKGTKVKILKKNMYFKSK